MVFSCIRSTDESVLLLECRSDRGACMIKSGVPAFTRAQSSLPPSTPTPCSTFRNKKSRRGCEGCGRSTGRFLAQFRCPGIHLSITRPRLPHLRRQRAPQLYGQHRKQIETIQRLDRVYTPISCSSDWVFGSDEIDRLRSWRVFIG